MIPIKIETLRFNKIKEDYLQKVKTLLIHGGTKEENKADALKQVYNKINGELIRLEVDHTLEEIIVADFTTLREIKDKLDNNQYKGIDCVYEVYQDSKNANSKKRCVKDSVFEKLYNTYDKIDKKWLIDELKITVCPYCNRDFINNRGNSTSAQLDHFYPRSKYPIFAISLCNLIPSCYACNHNKREKLIDISPYDNGFDFDESITFSYHPISENYLNDYTQLEITMKYNNEISNNIKYMGIKDGYKIHTDYVQEIIKKAEVYNNDQVQEFLNNFGELFSSKEEILRIVFANYIDEKELGKRPLAKLTKDILIELGVDI